MLNKLICKLRGHAKPNLLYTFMDTATLTPEDINIKKYKNEGEICSRCGKSLITSKDK